MIRTCRSQDAVGGVGKEGISPRRTQRTRRRKEDEERMDARTNRVRGCSVSVPGLPRPVRSWIRRLRTLDIVSLFRPGRGRPGSLTSTCIALRTRCFLGVLCVLRGAMPSCSAEPRSFSRPHKQQRGPSLFKDGPRGQRHATACQREQANPRPGAACILRCSRGTLKRRLHARFWPVLRRMPLPWRAPLALPTGTRRCAAEIPSNHINVPRPPRPLQWKSRDSLRVCVRTLFVTSGS